MAIPTETVYGLAANGLNTEAVARIFSMKQRPSFDPLILHFYGPEQLPEYVESVPELASRLLNAFAPGPLTLILDKRSIIPDIVTAGMESVAIRFPGHPLTRELLKVLPFPLAAPSANVFGQTSPTRAEHVQAQLGDQLSWILDGGACAIGLESTIVDVRGNDPIILRQGGITQEALEALIGQKLETKLSSSKPSAPGMLLAHYSPGVPLLLIKEGEALPEVDKKCGFLGFRNKRDDHEQLVQFILSKSGGLEEAAANLFEGLRVLAAGGVEQIFAEAVPDIGLGRAINDRLRRAAHS